MKKRKQYKPKGINPNSAFDAIRLSKPVCKESNEKLTLDAYLALEAFTKGVAKKAHFDILASTVDLAMMLDNTHFDGSCKDEIDYARAGMIRCKDRFIDKDVLGLDGEAYNAIKYVIEVYAEQLKQVTGAEVVQMAKVREQHIRSGNFYKGDVEPKKLNGTT